MPAIKLKAVKPNAPFRTWVPRWMQAIVGVLLLLTVAMLSGTYTGSSIDVSSALGLMSEDINMAYYASSVAMSVAYPLIPKIRGVVTTKTVLLAGLSLQVLLSLICANSNNAVLIIMLSFTIGFLKAFAMMEMVLILKPIFSRRNIRSEFYAYFYPMVFGVGQISMALTSELAYNYQWQYTYYFVMAMLLIAIIMVLVCFRYGRRPIKIPFHEIDGVSILLISAALLMLTYVATYGKVRDWFASPDITICTILILPIIWIFVRRQQTRKSPYLNIAVLKNKKALVGYFFMSVVMFLSSSSTIVSNYTNYILKLDSIHTNSLNLALIPGFIVGAFVCFWWFRLQVWRFRVLVFWGMSAFVGCFALLYFGMAPNGTYEFLFLPTFLRGIGMMILFIAFGVYAVENLEPKLMIYNAFFLVCSRSVIAPVLGASFFTNIIYRLTQRTTMILSEGVDLQHEISASTYNDALAFATHQGLAAPEAAQFATTNLYAYVSPQATLLSLKIITGYLLIGSIILMIVSRFTPFHKTLKVKVVKSGDDMA